MPEPFLYPTQPHIRRHGPVYTAYESYRPWLRDEFSFRCVYCLKREQWGIVRRTFDVDHFVPQQIAPDRLTDYDNLVYKRWEQAQVPIALPTAAAGRPPHRPRR